jgi:hypothetical protein
MIVDAVLTYQFIKKLITPFNKMPAYALHLIDEDGNFLKRRNNYTSQEKKALGLFDIMVINLKKLIAKVPFGKTRIATLAAAMLLLRSTPLKEQALTDTMFSLEEDFNKTLEELELMEDMGAVNNVGGIAGTGDPRLAADQREPGVLRSAAMRYKSKNKKNAPSPILAPMLSRATKNVFNVVKKGKSILEDSTLQYHTELNSKIWDGMKLKDEVRGKLLQIGAAWVQFAKIHPDTIQDMIITGGNVNYNYTPQSDIDLHVVISRDSMNPDRALVDEYLQDKKILWTLSHQDINIYGYPVELYAQDIAEQPHANQGVFSVKRNQWIAMPQHLDIDFENDYHLQKKVQFYKDLIDKMVLQNATDGSFDMIKQKIRKMRGDSIAKDGEFAFGNLVFKELRNQGYLDKMDMYQKSNQDKALSLS